MTKMRVVRREDSGILAWLFLSYMFSLPDLDCVASSKVSLLLIHHQRLPFEGTSVISTRHFPRSSPLPPLSVCPAWSFTRPSQWVFESLLHPISETNSISALLLSLTCALECQVSRSACRQD